MLTVEHRVCYESHEWEEGEAISQLKHRVLCNWVFLLKDTSLESNASFSSHELPISLFSHWHWTT